MALLDERDALIDDLLEVVVALVEALDHAETELVQLGELEVPLPDRLLKQLEQRDAMAATLRRLKPEKRAGYVAVYREEAANVTRTDDGGKVPVSGEAMAEIAGALEFVRRRAVVCRPLDLALRDALLRSALAGS
jgi:hypothetical protein